MKIFKSKHKLQKDILNAKNISFIPTMGGLHKGHESLIQKSKFFSGKSLVSIFVNPKQFDVKKEFTSYPKNLKKDLTILRRLKVDYVYMPSFKDIYSFTTKKKVYLDKFSKKLCGKNRKGHFEGVLNVVNRFLEIIEPKYIFLGVKDFQQLKLINIHIKKMKIKTKIISCKTIREKNGVACSTRNKNLNKSQLTIASKIYYYLKHQKKIKNLKIKNIKKNLINLGADKIDYIEYYNSKTLKKVKSVTKNFKILIAYYLNEIRLIDNF